jgi:DNA-binding SARP family transcriptional activator/tetratricopeptide (TPR) repeat protein
MGAGGGAGDGGLIAGLLGPVEVRSAGGTLAGVPQPRLRVLIAMLAIAPGRVASDEALVDALWGEEWSRERERNLHTHVSALRRLLAAAEPDRDTSRLMRSGGGYRLDMSGSEVDAGLFRSLAARGRAAARGGDIATAAAAFAAALALWRGPAMSDVTGLCPRLVGDAASLEDLRAAVLEERVECDLALGSHAEVAAEGPGYLAQFPLRERLAGQVMVALWRAGRRGEALAVYDSTRRTLAHELGIDPGPDLTRLHASVLADDPSLAAPAPAAVAVPQPVPEVTPAREVTVSPPPSGGRVPRQLPAGVGHFTGRAPELKALDELLDRPTRSAGAVAVTAVRGMAGIGKTALAVHWAHKVADRFPDGQLYVNLRGFDSDVAPVTPDEVTGWFLAALGVPGPAIPADPQARAGLYRSTLADRKVLLLLDNARDAAQVRPLLAGGPGCLTLVTSRSSMASLAVSEGAQLNGLDHLDAADATRLLTARLDPQRVAAEPEAVAQLVRLCSGLPLALAIAAARAAESPGLPLAALVAGLEEESDRLDVLDLDDSTSVRAVFSWSLLHVSEQADRMFTFLGMHRGPDISLAAAASLAALPAAAARSILDELASASLVAEHRPGRYVLHDLIRAYAAEYALATYSEDELDDAIGRTLDHYLHTMARSPIFGRLAPFRGGIPQPAAGVSPEELAGHGPMLAWLEAEHLVLRQAIEQASDASHAAAAWALYYLFAHSAAWQGTWAEYEAAGHAALTAAKRADDQAGLGWICGMLATFHAEFGTADQVLAERYEALEHFERAGDPGAQAYGHQYLSDALCRGSVKYGAMLRDDPADPGVRRRASDGLAHAQRALVLHREAGNRGGVMWAHQYCAYHSARLGDAVAAQGHCEQALELAAELGDPQGQSFARFMMGFACQASGDLDRAVACFNEALSLVPDGGPSTAGMRAELLSELGETYRAAGDLPAARDAFGQAMEYYQSLHHPGADELRARLDSGLSSLA